eukprot:Clim_evm42s243 gene=Clim_evmTU42s243
MNIEVLRAEMRKRTISTNTQERKATESRTSTTQTNTQQPLSSARSRRVVAHSSSTETGGTREHKQCIKWRDEAVKSSPIVRGLMFAMKRRGCGVGEANLLCEPCSEYVGGGFSLDDGIILCENRLISQGHAADTLAHELIHAFDHCRAKVNWDSCLHHACSEIRAANLSGDCNFWREISRGYVGIGGHHKECVKRRAYLSVKLNPSCTEQQAKIAVDNAFDTCFKDLAPFLEIPRKH